MSTTAITGVRRPVSERVFEEACAAILRGELSPGDALPSERVLAERHEVSRHAVREALRRLEQARLVEVRHGGATRVLDWRRTAGLDVLAQLPFAGERAPGAEVLEGVVAARRWIGLDVARLAAARADAARVAALRAQLAAPAPGDLATLSHRYEDLWRGLVDAAGNLAWALAFNSLLAAIAVAPEASRRVFAAEAADTEAQAALVEAVAAGDGELAARRADALLSRSLTTTPENRCTT